MGLDIEDTATSSSTQGGGLRLGSNDGAVMASGHRLGVLEFAGAEDTSSTMTVGARIEAVTDATWSASENGASLDFYTTDGNASQTKQMSIAATGVVSTPSYIVEGRPTIKVPASAFHGNDDDTWDSLSSSSIAYIEDDGVFGVRVGDADGELFAWVNVPLGYTATKVRVYGWSASSANEVVVKTWDITDGTVGSEISNTGLEVGDDTALASNHVGADDNMLLIEVLVTATSDIVYGAVVTIQPT